MIAEIRELRADDFTTRQAVSLWWTLWRIDHLPHRLLTLDSEALQRDELEFTEETWWWRGRILWRRAA